MRSEQPLKKLQSSCCEPDFTEEGESAENRGEVLKPLITEISTAVSTTLSEFNDKDIQKTLDPPMTAEPKGKFVADEGKFVADRTKPGPVRLVVAH